MTDRSHNTRLTILGTSIRQDAEGRYCLNDCHKASGGDLGKRPGEWLRNEQTQALVAELTDAGISASPVSAVKGGMNQGTYAAKELILAYAQWISAPFHVQCLRALLGLMKGDIPASIPSVTVSDLEATVRQVVGGIVKGVVHKQLIETVAPVLENLRVTHQTGTSAVTDRTAKEWLDHYGCISRGRHALAHKLSNTLRAIATKQGIPLLRCARTGTWLFPHTLSVPFMEGQGRAWIRLHNEAVETGQSALALRGLPKTAINVIPFDAVRPTVAASLVKTSDINVFNRDWSMIDTHIDGWADGLRCRLRELYLARNDGRSGDGILSADDVVAIASLHRSFGFKESVA